MGNTSSRSPDNHIFQKELGLLNNLITNIINEKDIFRNNDYNFLSKDVCSKYQIVLEEELSKHLKISVKSLGVSLYIIPKNDDSKLTKLNLTKNQICEKISNHYIKILYIMSLVKYVYNLEMNGDLSITGIIMRNIRVLDDIMEINFCDLPHKNYNIKGKEAYKIDFSKLEGFSFFVDYFLDKSEANAFLKVIKAILARNTKQKISNIICNYISTKQFKINDIRSLEKLYESRFNNKLICNKKDYFTENKIFIESEKPSSQHNINLNIFVNKDNPILSKEFCFAPRKIIIKTSNIEGRKILDLYNHMKNNYSKNIKNIITILDKLIIKQKDVYSLKDIDKKALDIILDEVKINIKTLFIQSIIDYQNLLDKAKLIPSIQFSPT